jgi:hypothetical protein
MEPKIQPTPPTILPAQHVPMDAQLAPPVQYARPVYQPIILIPPIPAPFYLIIALLWIVLMLVPIALPNMCWILLVNAKLVQMAAKHVLGTQLPVLPLAQPAKIHFMEFFKLLEFTTALNVPPPVVCFDAKASWRTKATQVLYPLNVWMDIICTQSPHLEPPLPQQSAFQFH